MASYRIKGRFVNKADYEKHMASSNELPLPELMLAIEKHRTAEVDSMVARINTAIDERTAFEVAKSPHGSHIHLRQVRSWFLHSRSTAALLIACEASPEQLFNRVRKEGTRSNLKALKKVRQLVDYVTGKTMLFERVSLALFASTIIAARMGKGWIASPEQELILSAERVTSLPPSIQSAIDDYKHKHMSLTGDSRPQACQFRTTYNNLNAYHVLRDEFGNVDYTQGIAVVLDNPIVRYLTARWGLDTVN